MKNVKNVKKYSSSAIFAIVILFLSFAVLAMPGAITQVGWPEIRDEFGLRQDSIGLLLIMGTIGHILSAAFNGRLMYWLGAGNLMLASLATYGASLYGYWLTPSWELLVILALAGGWAGGTIDATGNTVAAARYDDRIMNWLHGFFGLGATVGPMIISLVVIFGSDWRGGALVFGTLALILFAVVLIFRPFSAEPTPQSLPHENNETPSSETDSPDKNSENYSGNYSEESDVPGLTTLSNPVVWFAIVFFFIYGGIEVSIGQWTFTLFTESRGLDEELARLWVSIYWGTFTFGRFLFGVISPWLPTKTWLRLCLAGTTLAVILLLFPNQPVLGVVGLALSGLFQAPIFATLISAMPGIVGREHASNAIGYVVGAAGIGIAILPSVAGVLAERTTLEAIIPFIVVLCFALIIMFELLWRRQSAEG